MRRIVPQAKNMNVRRFILSVLMLKKTGLRWLNEVPNRTKSEAFHTRKINEGYGLSESGITKAASQKTTRGTSASPSKVPA
jgi:hypothetical protein